jgi:hypothetical protein
MVMFIKIIIRPSSIITIISWSGDDCTWYNDLNPFEVHNVHVFGFCFELGEVHTMFTYRFVGLHIEE